MQIDDISDNGIECLRKSAIVPDDIKPTRYALRTQVIDGNNRTFQINESGQLLVVLDGKVVIGDSSNIPLLANATFTGIGFDTLDYALIFVTVFANVASATNGLCVQTSSDGITWRDGDCFTIPANVEKTFSIQTNKKYARLRYVNGNTNQSTFDLHVVAKKTNSKPSSHRILDSIVSDDDATLVKAVLTGENPSNTFVNFQATQQGNFKVSLEEFENDVSVNSNTQLKTTTFDSLGNEGQSIIGVNYIAGKSGVDAMTESLQTIDYEHHEIHSGDHFFYCNFATLGSGASIDFGVTTPNTTKWAHVTFEISGTSQTEFYIYEASAFTGGTTVTAINNNRNSATASTLVIVANPTVTSVGTLLSMQSKGLAGTNPASADSAGVTERNREIIFKQNTKYILRITSRDTNNIVSYCANWYETISKN